MTRHGTKIDVELTQKPGPMPENVSVGVTITRTGLSVHVDTRVGPLLAGNPQLRNAVVDAVETAMASFQPVTGKAI